MSAVRDLLRGHVAGVPAYVTARSAYDAGILLDANENAFGSPVRHAGAALHRYPDPKNRELRAALAAVLRADTERLWLGNGSDDAIDLLVRALVDPGAPVAVPAPSYGVYAQRVTAHAGVVKPFLLDSDFDLDVDAAVAASRGAGLCIVCSPNNPTGNLLSRKRVMDLLERTEGIVAVDEAYIEFAGEEHSLASLAGSNGPAERLVVIRTLSKAWGLAGVRIGSLIGDPELVSALDRIGLPYPLSSVSAEIGVRALEQQDLVTERIKEIRSERQWLASELAKLGLRVLPSDANFLCFFVGDPGAVQARLAGAHRVVVRDRSRMPGLAGALRVTVGTRPENRAFLSGLRQELSR